MMSSCSMDAGPEQLCYIPCNFCNIVLAVSVPCTSLFDMVTVRCGHCTNLWSVNMAAAFQSLSWQDLQGPGQCNQEYRIDTNINMNNGGSSSKCNNSSRLASMRAPTNHVTQERAVNRRESPEKRQRVPSAYNQFIKEEIQRIKANNPDISHREAFSTAAKNWAHFPHIHFGLMLESNNQANKMDNASEKHLMSRAAPALLNK
ncbi:axial regulator YABBY 5 isoform X1 [Arachis stenosperma]|uniref:axial regulator YABBY 5 isoform X1 n=1 Tax=Arachis hypogaea TaxID=3818 RepID=UPI000DECCDDB|nr:axial regulator YABBY 5 isoform X1 [Arachis hypogaea]XP_057725714.1 axial regulator YABBY 5 isoform X1 [Arachis stenosperma]